MGSLLLLSHQSQDSFVETHVLIDWKHLYKSALTLSIVHVSSPVSAAAPISPSPVSVWWGARRALAMSGRPFQPGEVHAVSVERVGQGRVRVVGFSPLLLLPHKPKDSIADVHVLVVGVPQLQGLWLGKLPLGPCGAPGSPHLRRFLERRTSSQGKGQ